MWWWMLLFSLSFPSFQCCRGKTEICNSPNTSTDFKTLQHGIRRVSRMKQMRPISIFKSFLKQSLILFRLSLPGVSSSLQRNCKQMILYIVSPNCMKNSAKSYQQFSAVPGLQNSNQLQWKFLSKNTLSSYSYFKDLHFCARRSPAKEDPTVCVVYGVFFFFVTTNSSLVSVIFCFKCRM